MRLSKTTNYAIRILIDCAQAQGRLVKVADISARRGITPQNTFKIVHLLSRAGFVEAVRGRHGGVRLARPATAIRIGDVVRAMETTRVEMEPDPSQMRRSARQALADIDHIFDAALEAFIGVLDEHTLHDMAMARREDQVPERRAPRLRARAKTARQRSGHSKRQPSPFR